MLINETKVGDMFSGNTRELDRDAYRFEVQYQAVETVHLLGDTPLFVSAQHVREPAQISSTARWGRS